MIKGLGEAANQLGIESKKSDNRKTKEKSRPITNPHQVPMMYRAQIGGRCSLQFAGKNDDLEAWRDEWIYPQNNQQPLYQHRQPLLGKNGKFYRIKIDFPFRVFSNCGQDSILRPVLGKNGIPFIPGSSIKGLFRRVCSPEQAVLYCGDGGEKLSPGILRFHGAYPIDDWAGTKEATIHKKGNNIKETRYRMMDVVHPQQKRQVEGSDNNKNKATALAVISFYQPSFIFEFSSASSEIDWQEVEQLILNALLKGLGGKTSTGYGLGGHLPSVSAALPDYPLNIPFSATGVSPLLRNGEPEFRPNLFKATLRGHFTRLLSGVCDNEKAITKEVDRFFGSSTSPGIVQIYWESQKEEYNTKSANATYETEGVLHIKAPPLERKFVELVLKFSFIMGGFGKSWRRVDHKKFYPEYKKLSQGINIGCHWEYQDSTWCNITTIKGLKDFFDNLHESCNSRLGSKNLDFIRLKETWHPQRVAVYSKIVTNSEVVQLFHNDIFKKTPAIGGKNVNDTRPKFVSSVWHRMLPINNNQYLEIVTVFHHNRSAWKHQEQGNQLKNFVKELKDKKFQLTYGKAPS